MPRITGFNARMLGLALAGAAGLLGCEEAQEPASQAAQRQQGPIPVGTVAARMQPVTLGERFVGRIQARQQVAVHSRVSGFIEERLFEEGETVQQGAPLFRIEDDTYQAVVQQRRADLAAAEAELHNAEVQLERARELVRRETVSQATLDEREAAARVARASVLQAEAALRQAEINLGDTRINAPISGRAGRANFDVGDLVGPESGALAEIVSQDPMYVVFPVSQRRLLQAQRSAAGGRLDPSRLVVRLQLTEDEPYPHTGRIDFVANSVQRGTDTVEVRAVVANPERLLRDEQFVQITITQEEPEQALVIPQRAVQADQQGLFVLTVDPQDQIAVRRIQTGDNLDEGRAIVTSGLQPGEPVVVQGIQRVQPGTPVEARPVDAEAGAASP